MGREAEGSRAGGRPAEQAQAQAAEPRAPGLRTAGPPPAGQRAPETVHNRIAVLRAERGISRRQLAEALDVHYQTVGYLERGEYSPSLFLALRIAEHFEVPVEVVFSTRPFPRIGS
ncbi:helix-turn-helix transcriptional regulator [Cellulomonas sp. 179-A 4D5 NHS]|uniref:helix-turn-helix transcriptional regulator n=1 Tax=Cellulomonas sp. 179-A 4D5 NHS TaxID=3142378 RepID=UPI0039A3EC78